MNAFSVSSTKVLMDNR
uniref:Uncharacterized protein n=1 Tax=Anguilla anguilla TaxID=7936 RepID=A0A0E9VSJ8_ANGAN